MDDSAVCTLFTPSRNCMKEVEWNRALVKIPLYFEANYFHLYGVCSIISTISSEIISLPPYSSNFTFPSRSLYPNTHQYTLPSYSVSQVSGDVLQCCFQHLATVSTPTVQQSLFFPFRPLLALGCFQIMLHAIKY